MILQCKICVSSLVFYVKITCAFISVTCKYKFPDLVICNQLISCYPFLQCQRLLNFCTGLYLSIIKGL